MITNCDWLEANTSMSFPLGLLRFCLYLTVAGLVSYVPDGSASVDLNQEAVELHGEFTQGALIRGKSLAGVNVFLNDQALHVSDQGDFVFGFGRNAKLSQKLRLTLGEQSLTLPIELKSRDYQVQRIQGVPQRTVDPPAPEVLKRIRQETAQVIEARANFADRLDFLGDFHWPLDGSITGVYGSQRVYNGKPRRPHYGIDIAAPEGTKVLAPKSGEVTLVHADMFYSGGTLIIDHGYGVSSTFLHLKKSLVAVGDQVKQGDPIALVGSTGRSTGAHLDWRINWFKTRIDAQLVAPPR